MNKNISEKTIYSTKSGVSGIILDAMLKEVTLLTPLPSMVGPEIEIKSIRDSKTYWLPWDHWIGGILHNMFISANNDFFHYDIDHFDSGIQVLYYEKGSFFKWHIDGKSTAEKEEQNELNKERKLSMSLLLTDDYEGGHLEFEYIPEERLSLKPDIGEAIIFPSWIPHRVTPVTSGKRICITSWMNGPCFK